LVQHAPTPAAFRAAVEAYRFDQALPLLPASAVLLLGNAHGAHASREPAVLYGVAHALGARALALEWSHDELGELVERFLADGRFDLDALWDLPQDAECFSADGRFTAGHVALLERLHREDALDQLIPFDQLDGPAPPPPELRDARMGARILDGWDASLPLLVVVGAAHVPALAAALRTEPAMLDYGPAVPMPDAALTLSVPSGPPAVVPAHA
jgi:hypothetical protein